MRKYETLLLLSPELSGDERTAILDTCNGVFEKVEAANIVVDEWGARDLAYPVQKQMRGYYVRLEYDCTNNGVAELERIIRITDGVFKFMTVQLADELEAEEVA